MRKKIPERGLICAETVSILVVEDHEVIIPPLMIIRPVAAHKKYRRLLNKDLDALFAPKKRGKKKRACPACSKSVPKHFLKRAPYVMCGSCCLVYMDSLPGNDEVNSYYRSSASASFFHEFVLAPTAAVRRKNLFNARLDWMAQFMKSRTGVCLDVGASIGTFVEALRSRRFTPIGLELNAQALSIGRHKGLPLVQNLDELDDHLDGRFLDAVTAWEVLAHVPEPIAYFKTIVKRMKKGAYFFLTTPNTASAEYGILKENHPNFVFPFLQLFSPGSIRIFFKKVGLKVVALDTPGNMDLENIRAHLPENSDLPDFAQKILKSEEPWARDFRSRLQESLKSSGLSGHMRVVARKV